MRSGVFGRRRKGARCRRAMGPPRAPLWLLWAGLGSFVPGSRCGSSRHSLSYSYLEVSESSQRVPKFLSMVHLDDEPIARYDSPTRKLVPLVPWMEVEEAKTFVVPEMVFRADLEWLSELNPQTGELHTWQVVWGCELREDGNKGGFFCYGYDGRDCISFNKETLTWVEAQPQAQKIKEKLKDPVRFKRNKVFLEKDCLEWLQKCLSYQKEAPKKIEPPVGKVTRKVVNDSLEVLICQAFGFYPKEIQATWMRDREICQNETLRRNVAPNSDGTYYVWISIEIDFKERDRFRCYLEHKGLQEPLVLAWKNQTATGWQITGGTVAIIIFGVVIVIIAVVLIYICWKKCHPNMRTCCDPDSQENRPPSVELQSMSPCNASSENTTSGGQRPQMAPRGDAASRFLNGGEQQMMKMLRIMTIIIINMIVKLILFMITFNFTIISHICQVTQNLSWLIQNLAAHVAGLCMYWYLQLRGGIQNFLLTVLWERLGGRGMERI
ncbi:major histocompatibility complex class I-related gene protein-like isoform X2 [Thamnophis elegans]|uniref:major histocompatibility complex class I-related gene protein-like isoform X2 n=1 Tax=Thamnophis elegans TaxID=35005 RepID=UPI00137905CE|nr:major histocompatibility complex class I-related gene protein-like isoform X2 [Thamnophis elegans]